MNQYLNIRKLAHCPNCKEEKDAGLILCWPCHGIQKERNDGMYSKRLEEKLAKLEAALEGIRIN